MYSNVGECSDIEAAQVEDKACGDLLVGRSCCGNNQQSSTGSSGCNNNCDSGYSSVPVARVDKCGDGTPCIVVPTLYVDSPVPVPATAQESSWIELLRKLTAEALGTGLLVFIVVGSGIMAQTLSPNDVGLQLFENAFATAGGLFGLIVMFGPVSGAHFNPIVSFVDFLHEDMNWRDLILYTIVQIIGGIIGALLANAEFDIDVAISNKPRKDHHLWLSEVIGTASLLLVIHGCLRTGQKSSVPYAVAAWVAGGYFFTSSTIFANPAVTIARMFSDTFAGIDPNSVGQFIGFQYLGGILGFLLIKFFYPKDLHVKKDDNLYLRICVSSYEHNKLA